MIPTRRYGLYPWFPELGSELVHPDDLQKLRDFHPFGKVFHTVEGEDWIVLHYQDHRFRVRPEKFRPVSGIRYWIGDRVMALQSGRLRAAAVDDVHWHFKLERPMYFLSFDGKRSSRRYFDDELDPA